MQPEKQLEPGQLWKNAGIFTASCFFVKYGSSALIKAENPRTGAERSLIQYLRNIPAGFLPEIGENGNSVHHSN
jgi:hypothetical protein